MNQEPSNNLANRSTNVTSNQDLTFAKVSFWFAILSIPFSVCFLFPGSVFAVIAIITGYLGKTKAEQNPEKFGEVSKATSGMIIGSVIIALHIIIVIIYVNKNGFKL